MFDSNDLLKIIKTAAIDAIKSTNPIKILFGIVATDKPLIIQIEQKLKLEKEQIVLTRNVTKFKTKIDKKEVEIDNSLKKGDKLILLSIQGGQQFIVLDRLGR